MVPGASKVVPGASKVVPGASKVVPGASKKSTKFFNQKKKKSVFIWKLQTTLKCFYFIANEYRLSEAGLLTI